MTVQFKFFQIVDEKAKGDIAAVRMGRQARQDAIIALLKEFGADEIKIYGEMVIDAVVFPRGHVIDSSVWKKRRGGWVPKVKTDEAEKLAALPKCEAFESVLERWGLGGEMVPGEPTRSGGGFPMHSSHLLGSFKNNFFYVKVPYTGEYDKPTLDGLKEIKEWEALKGMDEGA